MNLDKNIEKLEQKIKNNASKIDDNAEKILKNSYALEIMRDYKHEAKRWFTALIIVLCMWFVTIGYLVYVLNDIGTVEESTIDIEEVETIDNSHIKIGDDVWEKSN